MDISDRKILKDYKKLYPVIFENGVIVDAGSRIMNGSVLEFLGEEAQKNFIGIDRFPKELDRTHITYSGFIHEYPGNEIVDMVTCFNTFEHDFYWKLSMKRLIELLKPGGLFIFQLVLSGPEHGTEIGEESYGEIIDGKRYYRNMIKEEVEEILKELPIEIKEYRKATVGRDFGYFVGIKTL